MAPVFLPPPPCERTGEPTSGPSWVLVLLAAIVATAIAVVTVLLLGGRDDTDRSGSAPPSISGVSAEIDADDDARGSPADPGG